MGRLNRLIEIQRKVITRDPRFGSEVETWVKLDTVWAELVQVKPEERFIRQSNRTVNVSTKRFRLFTRDDVDELMRVIDDAGKTWGIQGIIKNDRQYMTLQLETVA